MNIAYAILAHHNPPHLKRLITKLSTPQCEFFIHLDKKTDEKEFASLKRDGVHFCTNRVGVYWGGFSMITAEIELLTLVLNSRKHFDYIVLLTGSDYPIRSNTYIHHFFKTLNGSEFMNCIMMPSDAASKPISRLTRYRINPDNYLLSLLRIRLKKPLPIMIGRNYKKVFGSLFPYGGSGNWTLTTDACRYIINFIDKNNHIVTFFKNTFCPDEMFFQTILCNSSFKKNIRHNITFTDWPGKGAHPVYINFNHVKQFEQNNKMIVSDVYGTGEVLFARKFAPHSDELLDYIDATIASD